MKKLIILIIILGSCNSKTKSFKQEDQINFVINSFNENDKLVSKKFTYNKILTPFKIAIKGDLVIVGSDADSRLIHLIDKSSMGYIQGKGVKGEGPGEFINVRGLDSGFNDSTIWAYSNVGKAFYEFSLYDTISLAKSKVSQNENWFQALSMNWKQPNQIISYMNRGPSKLEVFDSSGNVLDTIGLWSAKREISVEANFILSDLHQGAKSFNTKNQVYVLSKLKFDQFEIFDLKKKKHVIVNGPFNQYPEYEIGDDGSVKFAVLDTDTKYGYTDVNVTENYIFLVFIGKTLAEGRALGEISRDIFQFDLEGNPIAHFQTDVPINSIAVDELNKTIYAITEDENPGIAVFEYR